MSSRQPFFNAGNDFRRTASLQTAPSLIFELKLSVSAPAATAQERTSSEKWLCVLKAPSVSGFVLQIDKGLAGGMIGFDP
jgi:hypothetical protein